MDNLPPELGFSASGLDFRSQAARGKEKEREGTTESGIKLEPVPGLPGGKQNVPWMTCLSIHCFCHSLHGNHSHKFSKRLSFGLSLAGNWTVRLKQGTMGRRKPENQVNGILREEFLQLS